MLGLDWPCWVKVGSFYVSQELRLVGGLCEKNARETMGQKNDGGLFELDILFIRGGS